jgi:hypothetical protein
LSSIPPGFDLPSIGANLPECQRLALSAADCPLAYSSLAHTGTRSRTPRFPTLCGLTNTASGRCCPIAAKTRSISEGVPSCGSIKTSEIPNRSPASRKTCAEELTHMTQSPGSIDEGRESALPVLVRCGRGQGAVLIRSPPAPDDRDLRNTRLLGPLSLLSTHVVV